ncbi:MAG: hypothetical protein RL375_859 [Pseudomonadota bacterium]|jgi:hypothetical protein
MAHPPRSTPPARLLGLGSPHAFKGFGDWIEVFKAGTHTDSKGRAVSFSEADLDQMVANVALGAAPAVLGHPQHNDPAYGWADQVKRDGTSLYAKFSGVHPDFEAGVKTGAYRNRSVSVFKDADHGWRLQHVGWLGAQRPAIPGLKPVEFKAAAEADAHTFVSDELATSWAIGDIANLFRGLRDWLIGEKGLDVADRVLSGWSIDAVKTAADTLREQALAEATVEDKSSGALAPMFSAAPAASAATASLSTTGADPMALTPEDLARAVAETEARIRAELQAQFSAQTATTAAELARLQAERQGERIGTQITAWKAAGLVLPAEEAGLREFMCAIEAGDNEFAFSAGTGEVKQTRAAWFAQFMAGRKPVVKLGQNLGGDNTAPPVLDQADPAAIAHEARQYQAAEAAKGHSIAIDQAVTAVMARAAKAA